MNKIKKIQEKEFWLYHPALVNPVTGATGRYKPAGDNMVEMEFEVKKETVNLLSEAKK